MCVFFLAIVFFADYILKILSVFFGLCSFLFILSLLQIHFACKISVFTVSLSLHSSFYSAIISSSCNCLRSVYVCLFVFFLLSSLCASKVKSVRIWTLRRSFTTHTQPPLEPYRNYLLCLKVDLWNKSFRLPTSMSFSFGCQQDTLFAGFPLSQFCLFMSLCLWDFVSAKRMRRCRLK